MKQIQTKHSLQNQLSKFGLNPSDWKTEDESSNQVYFRKHKDPDFILLGTCSVMPLSQLNEVTKKLIDLSIVSL